MANSAISAELLTTSEAAQMLNVGQRTLARWSSAGWAPKPVKIVPGRRGTVRYRRSELLAWIGDGCKPVGGGA